MTRERVQMTIAIVVMIVLMAAGWWLARVGSIGRGGPPSDVLSLKTPVATIPLGDGSRLEVYGLVEDEWVDGVMSKPPGNWNWGSTGETTSVDGDRDMLTIKRFTMGEKLAGICYLPGEGRLVMSIRHVTRSGVPERLATLKPGSLNIRLFDGGGLWVDGSGPFGAIEDPQCRGIVSFPGWPRSEKDLVFQAELKGLAPVEFRLPNPAASSPPASWKAASLPQVKSGQHWEVRLVKAKEITVEGRGKGVIGEFEFSSDLLESGPFKPVEGSAAGVLGALGTRSMDLRHNSSLPLSSLAYPMPPDEPSFKFLYEIRYEPHFPYPRRAVPVIFAEGLVAPDGKRIELVSQHTGTGIKSMKVGPVGAPSGRWYPGSHQFTIAFDASWKDRVDRSSAEAVIGPLKQWTPVIFLDGADYSSGAVEVRNSGISSSGTSTTLDWKGDWTGELKPGMKVEIGIMAKWPGELLEFVVDRSSLAPE